MLINISNTLKNFLFFLKKVIGKQYIQAGIVAIIYVIALLFITIHLLHDSYNTYALDLGSFAQMLKNSLEGKFLFNNVGGLCQLAYHFSPILIFLIPIYWLFPFVQTLLVVQGIAFGISSFLIYYLARKYGLSHKISLLVEVLFIVNPLVWGVTLFDFHAVALAVPALLIMLIGYTQKRWTLFTIGLIGSLMTKEDVIITIVVFGMVMLIYNYIKNKKFDRASILIILSAIITYGIAILVSIWASDGEFPRMLSYGSTRYTYLDLPLNEAIPAALSTFFSPASLVLVFTYLIPLGLLPLFSIQWAAPGLFILGINLLSTCSSQHSEIRHAGTAAIAFLFVATINSIKLIKQRKDLQLRLEKLGPRLPVLITILMIASAFYINASSLSRFEKISFPDEHDAVVNSVIALIPDGATVTANNNIFSHLCDRTETYLPEWSDDTTGIENNEYWGYPDRYTEYIVIDIEHRQWYINGCWENVIMKDITDYYDLVIKIDGVMLYKLKE